MIHIKVTCDCANIPHDNCEHMIQLSEGSTVSDILKALVEMDIVGGMTYKETVEGHVFLRDYYVISPETEVFDGDRVLVILNLEGG